MAIINVEDAHILDETGAEVDKVTGLFTKDESTTAAEKAFAQLNIGGGGGGQNLLDNPFFTIHQMGTSGHTGVGYGVDRWKIRAGTGCTVTPKANYGITVSYTTTFDITYCLWIPPTMLAGKTCTLSIMMGGEILSATGVIGTGNQYYFGISDNAKHIRARVGALSTIGSGNLIINIEPLNSSGTLDIDAIKLEVGSVSTLENDAPPDYGTELAKCQRYLFRLTGGSWKIGGNGWCASATAADILITTPVTMRAKPTITYTGSWSIRTNGAEKAVTAMSVYDMQTNGVYCTFTTSGLTANQMASLVTTNGIIDLFADL